MTSPVVLMRRPFLVLLATLALLTMPLVLVEGAPGKPTPSRQSGTAPGATAEEARNRSEHEGRAAEGRPGPIGEFSLSASEQVVSGHFVTFAYNDSTIQSFTVGGLALFDVHVAGVPGTGGEYGVRASGAQLGIQTPHYRLMVHDNPEAVTKLDTDGIATLRFPPGARLVQREDGRIDFAIGNVTGTLRGDELQIAGSSVLTGDEVLLFLHASRGDFDVHRKDIATAIAKRHVGAEGTFLHKDDRVDEDVVSYGNVTMTTLKAEKGNLTLLVDGHGFDGRVLVLNVDGRIVGASNADQLSILFDAEAIQQADDITDVLDADDDGLLAEYYVVFDPATETFQLLVSVPHYSVHILSVTTLIPLPAPSVVLGVVAGVLLLAASGFVLFRRKE